MQEVIKEESEYVDSSTNEHHHEHQDATHEHHHEHGEATHEHHHEHEEATHHEETTHEHEHEEITHEHEHDHDHEEEGAEHGHVHDESKLDGRVDLDEICQLTSANVDKINAKKIDSFIMRNKCDFSWMFQDILKIVQEKNNEDHLPSKDYITIDVLRLNSQFDRVLDKAFNMAFLSLEDIRNGEMLRPFDCTKATEDKDSKKLLAQLRLCEHETNLDALKQKKHDYLEGHGQKKNKKAYSEQDIQKQWFVNKVAWRLRRFMDQMIETRIILPSKDEQDALKLFAQNRMLVKRGVHQQIKNEVNDKEIRALRKKVALLEVSMHSLKHKLADGKRMAKRNLEDARYQIEKQHQQEQAMREVKIKQLFDNEFKQIWLQKENIQRECEFKDFILQKLVNIVKRQELDTYNPYLSLPKPSQIYLKKLEGLMHSEKIRVKCESCYHIFQWTLNDMALIDNKINIMLADLDEPTHSSQIGTLELMKQQTSWARSKAVEAQELIEQDILKKRKQILKDQIFRSKMHQSVEGDFTYPIVPFSNEYLAELKAEMRLEYEVMEEERNMAERKFAKIQKERDMLAEQVTTAKKMAVDWMHEAIGYREKSAGQDKKILVLEDHLKSAREEFELKASQMQIQYNQLSEQIKEQSEKLMSDTQVELEIKQLVLEKKECYIQQLKIQLKKLIRLTEHPRLVVMLRQKFHDEQKRANSVGAESKHNVNDDLINIQESNATIRPKSANYRPKSGHRKILSFDHSLEHQIIPDEDTSINYYIYTDKMHSKTLYDERSKKNYLASPEQIQSEFPRFRQYPSRNENFRSGTQLQLLNHPSGTNIPCDNVRQSKTVLSRRIPSISVNIDKPQDQKSFTNTMTKESAALLANLQVFQTQVQTIEQAIVNSKLSISQLGLSNPSTSKHQFSTKQVFTFNDLCEVQKEKSKSVKRVRPKTAVMKANKSNKFGYVQNPTEGDTKKDLGSLSEFSTIQPLQQQKIQVKDALEPIPDVRQSQDKIISSQSFQSDYLKKMESVNIPLPEVSEIIEQPLRLENRYSARKDSDNLKHFNKKKVGLASLNAVKPMHQAYQKDKFKSMRQRFSQKPTLPEQSVCKITEEFSKPSPPTSRRESVQVTTRLNPKVTNVQDHSLQAATKPGRVFVHRTTHSIDPSIFNAQSKRVAQIKKRKPFDLIASSMRPGIKPSIVDMSTRVAMGGNFRSRPQSANMILRYKNI